eukprot:PhF_6_TR40216/c0_g1_i2/m.59728
MHEGVKHVPKFLVTLYRLLYESLLLPTDDFHTRVQKFAFSFLAFSTPIALLAGLGLLITGIATNSAALIATGILWALGSGISGGAWLYLRTTKHFPKLLIDVMSVTITILIFVSYLSIKHEGFIIFLVANTAGFTLVQTPNVLFHVGCSMLVVTIWAYNSSFADFLNVSSVRLPGFTEPKESAFALCMLGYLANSIVFGAVHFQHKACHYAIVRANATRDMCVAVTKKLCRYDTDGAKDAMALFQSNELETRLALVSLIENLEKYRPHIPNYVLDEQNVLSDDGDETDHSATGSASKVPSEVLMGDSAVLIDSYVSNNETIPLAPALVNTVPSSPETIRSRDITRVLINPVFIAEDGLDLDLASYEVSMNRFVNHIHTVAQPSHATIHGFIGDTVHVTWNTSRRTLQHPSKGALFLAWLIKDTGDENIRCYGAAATGPAHTFYAGDKHQLLLVHTGWEHKLGTMYGIAMRYSSVVMSQEMYDATRPFVESRWVDIISYDGKTPHRLYELLHERSAGEEWMYTLQNAAAKEDDISLAAGMCSRGEYADAITLLDTVRWRRTGEFNSQLVMRLERKALHALNDSIPMNEFHLITIY